MSLTVLCPNGHRQKVNTTPNMSLQQVIETVCTKKGFDPSKHKLVHHRNKLDLSSSIRFSGLPNNCLIEMEELDEDELRNVKEAMVSVCLQLGSGERIVQEFGSGTSLTDVLNNFDQEKLGIPQEGEEAVIVYLRNEIVGHEALQKTTLRSLGLTAGKGLFRFFYKKPETLKEQANVYAIKEKTPEVGKEKATPEERHLPMRLEPATLASIQPQTKEVKDEEMITSDKQENISKVEKRISEPLEVEKEKPMDLSSQSQIKESTPPSTSSVPPPDSTTNEEKENVECIINPVGPNEALIFSSDGSVKFTLPDDGDDDFFEHTLEDVKGRYKALRLEMKEIGEGDDLLTSDMRAAREEGEKLALLGRYKSSLVRILFPTRHTVQGVFKPHTTIGEIKDWLRPLLINADLIFQLYIVPPRTVLDEKSSLLDLGLVPASLIHFSVPDSDLQEVLKPEYLETLSNIQGANKAASQFRKGGKKRATGISGEYRPSESLASIPESSRSSDAMSSGQTSSNNNPIRPAPGAKVPKWFKPGK
eukprot:TRINITY_DN5479_c0_g1_i5.p1 TRINITY_DN5479_c0_g1~~TRINITY_DN5479_c0_g1_i5.p1  ORF type:complete len:533 (+),score=106.03 TRINITY_DN5479_c0_g1_i5:71-1669(+)